MNRLVIDYDPLNNNEPLRDNDIKAFCTEQLENLKLKEYSLIYINQELVLYMFRALLYKEYRHLQQQVMFKLNDVYVSFDKRMRTWDNNYPDSLYDKCLDILLEPPEDSLDSF